MSDIVTRLRSINGFGWQCGQALKDKGTYMRCLCGCSQPCAGSDGLLTITQPAILREAADTIERLTAERDEARREVSFLRPSVLLGAQTAYDYAESRRWDCFKEDGK